MNVQGIIQANQEGRIWRQDWQKVTGSVPYVAGNYYDLSMLAGSPRGNVYPGGLLVGTPLWYKSGGAMWHGTNVSPRKKHIVTAGVFSSSSTAGNSTFTFCDYLMFYPLIDFDLSGEQNFSNPYPIPRYPDGDGVMAFIVSTSDTGVSDHNISVRYTNSVGAEKETPFEMSGNPGAIIGQVIHAGVGTAGRTGMFIPLADGDCGIKSVQSIAIDSGSGAGWGCLVLCRPLLTITMSTYIFPSERSQLFHHPAMPEVKDEAFLGVLMGSGAAVAAGSRILGYLDFAW